MILYTYHPKDKYGPSMIAFWNVNDCFNKDGIWEDGLFDRVLTDAVWPTGMNARTFFKTTLREIRKKAKNEGCCFEFVPMFLSDDPGRLPR